MVAELNFNWGKTQYPLSTTNGYSPFQNISPQQFWILDFLSACLIIDAGAYYAQQVTQLKSIGLAGTLTPLLVSPTTIGYNPLSYLQEAQYLFPLLAMYPVSGDVKEFSISTFVQSISTYEIMFVMPAMSSAEREVLGPFILACRDIIIKRLENCYHPSYLNGLNVGQLAGFNKAGIHGWSAHNIQPPGGTNLEMPTLILNYKMWEMNQPSTISNLFPTTGLDGYISLDGYSPAQTIIQNFIITNSDYFPQPF